MSKKYNTRFEYITENLAPWLAEFADKEAKKEYSTTKKSDYMTNILDIVSRNKKMSVEAKVEELRGRVGLDLLEKSGTNENENIEKKEASFKPLSLHHKIAHENDQLFDDIRQFVVHTIHNRNGFVNTLALLDLVSKQLGVDEGWIKEHKNDLIDFIEQAKKENPPREYQKITPEQLARTDSQDDKKEPPLFLPNTQGNGQ